MEFLASIPLEIVFTWLGTTAVEYFCGKTNLFEANSIGELFQNAICKAFDKNRKI